MSGQKKVYMYLGLFAAVVVLSAFIYKTTYKNTAGRVPVLPSTSTSSTLPQIDISSSSTIEQVTKIALKLNREGRLFLTWDKLPDGTYSVKIYRSRKGVQKWKLWKTVVVQGASGERRTIYLTSEEAKTITDYDYVFEAESKSGTTFFVSSVADFNTTANADGSISTSYTKIQAPAALAPFFNYALQATGTAQNQRNTPIPSAPSGSSTQASSAASTAMPPKTNPLSPSYPVYYYTPSGMISATSSFPAPWQYFWVEHSQDSIIVGWQKLPEATKFTAVYRSISAGGPWNIFIKQADPDIAGPYSLSIIDEGVATAYYYKLEALDNLSSPLSSYGPIYLSP